jgi:hypothetical protein
MTAPIDPARQKIFKAAFDMPSMQKIMSRKTSITNAFACAVVPVCKPSLAEIEEALCVLGMDPADVRCAYCGDPKSEWDHLRPIVVGRRPTGYISEIANLVPSCGKCNQSKGNSQWRDWIVSTKKRSPTSRGIADMANRIARLEAYERWRSPTKIDFLSIISEDEWEDYWSECEGVLSEMLRCHKIADCLREKIVKRLGGGYR